jgi:hypothetical protein
VVAFYGVRGAGDLTLDQLLYYTFLVSDPNDRIATGKKNERLPLQYRDPKKPRIESK